MQFNNNSLEDTLEKTQPGFKLIYRKFIKDLAFFMINFPDVVSETLVINFISEKFQHSVISYHRYRRAKRLEAIQRKLNHCDKEEKRVEQKRKDLNKNAEIEKENDEKDKMTDVMEHPDVTVILADEFDKVKADIKMKFDKHSKELAESRMSVEIDKREVDQLWKEFADARNEVLSKHVMNEQFNQGLLDRQQKVYEKEQKFNDINVFALGMVKPIQEDDSRGKLLMTYLQEARDLSEDIGSILPNNLLVLFQRCSLIKKIIVLLRMTLLSKKKISRDDIYKNIFEFMK
jgi:hypothetical protein